MGQIDGIINHDSAGRAIGFEKLLLAGALNEVLDSDRKAQEDNERLADLIVKTSGVTGVTVEIVTESLEDLSAGELREKLEDLRDALFDHECEESDDVSIEEYEAWEDRQEELEEKIDEIKSLLEKMGEGDY